MLNSTVDAGASQRAPMSIDVLPHWMTDLIAPRPPENNRLALPGASQCGYELLRAFSRYADSRRLRFSLAAGTLLGAMRNRPSGLLQWEHDVDIYMPARDAFALIRHLRRDCSDGRYHRRSRWCRRKLHIRGLVERNGGSCCGFGFKLFHRKSDACELDVLVLSATDAPYMHGETPLWPLWGPLLARPWHWLSAAWLRATTSQEAASSSSRYHVLPEDVWRKSLMADPTRWCDDKEGDAFAWCGGPPLSFFHAEYFGPGELYPLRRIAFHGLKLPVPNNPWALLNRTYGADCAYKARLNEHRDAVADLRLAENAHLRKPARVKRKLWWQG